MPDEMGVVASHKAAWVSDSDVRYMLQTVQIFLVDLPDFCRHISEDQ
jgi:hypothetical protein